MKQHSVVKVGAQVAKEFVYFGCVKGIWTNKGQKTYHIRYQDGDEEDMTHEECEDAHDFFLQQPQHD